MLLVFAISLDRRKAKPSHFWFLNNTSPKASLSFPVTEEENNINLYITMVPLRNRSQTKTKTDGTSEPSENQIRGQGSGLWVSAFKTSHRLSGLRV